jgi:hypothetical protein
LRAGKKVIGHGGCSILVLVGLRRIRPSAPPRRKRW